MCNAFIRLREDRINSARVFARAFNEFEWKNLCSYRAFLTQMDKGLDTGNFLPAQFKAEEILLNDHLRKPVQSESIALPDYFPGDIFYF